MSPAERSPSRIAGSGRLGARQAPGVHSACSPACAATRGARARCSCLSRCGHEPRTAAHRRSPCALQLLDGRVREAEPGWRAAAVAGALNRHGRGGSVWSIDRALLHRPVWAPCSGAGMCHETACLFPVYLYCGPSLPVCLGPWQRTDNCVHLYGAMCLSFGIMTRTECDIAQGHQAHSVHVQRQGPVFVHAGGYLCFAWNKGCVMFHPKQSSNTSFHAERMALVHSVDLAPYCTLHPSPPYTALSPDRSNFTG